MGNQSNFFLQETTVNFSSFGSPCFLLISPNCYFSLIIVSIIIPSLFICFCFSHCLHHYSFHSPLPPVFFPFLPLPCVLLREFALCARCSFGLWICANSYPLASSPVDLLWCAEWMLNGTAIKQTDIKGCKPTYTKYMELEEPTQGKLCMKVIINKCWFFTVNY